MMELKALRKGASLLPAGIIEVNGTFSKGDIIKVLNKKKKINLYWVFILPF